MNVSQNMEEKAAARKEQRAVEKAKRVTKDKELKAAQAKLVKALQENEAKHDAELEQRMVTQQEEINRKAKARNSKISKTQQVADKVLAKAQEDTLAKANAAEERTLEVRKACDLKTRDERKELARKSSQKELTNMKRVAELEAEKAVAIAKRLEEQEAMKEKIIAHEAKQAAQVASLKKKGRARDAVGAKMRNQVESTVMSHQAKMEQHEFEGKQRLLEKDAARRKEILTKMKAMGAINSKKSEAVLKSEAEHEKRALKVSEEVETKQAAANRRLEEMELKWKDDNKAKRAELAAKNVERLARAEGAAAEAAEAEAAAKEARDERRREAMEAQEAAAEAAAAESAGVKAAKAKKRQHQLTMRVVEVKARENARSEALNKKMEEHDRILELAQDRRVEDIRAGARAAAKKDAAAKVKREIHMVAEQTLRDDRATKASEHMDEVVGRMQRLYRQKKRDLKAKNQANDQKAQAGYDNALQWRNRKTLALAESESVWLNKLQAKKEKDREEALKTFKAGLKADLKSVEMRMRVAMNSQQGQMKAENSSFSKLRRVSEMENTRRTKAQEHHKSVLQIDKRRQQQVDTAHATTMKKQQAVQASFLASNPMTGSGSPNKRGMDLNKTLRASKSMPILPGI